MRENRSKTLHYRRAVIIGSGLSLQQILSQILSTFPLVQQRWENLDQAGNHKRLFNDHYSQMGMEFGTFLAFESGTNRLLMKIRENVAAMDVNQIAPPAAAPGLRNEFLDSILYYGVRGNHVVLLQSASLRASQLESHLNWLIGKMGRSEHVSLVDKPNPEVQEVLKTGNIKKVRLRTYMESGGSNQVPDGQELSSQGTGVWSILKAVLGTEDLAKLPMGNVRPDDLTVDVVITYDRTISSAGQVVLDKLAALMMEKDQESTELVIPGVGRFTGNQLKLSNQISVSTNNGVVDANDLFKKMEQWIGDLIIKEQVNDE